MKKNIMQKKSSISEIKFKESKVRFLPLIIFYSCILCYEDAFAVKLEDLVNMDATDTFAKAIIGWCDKNFGWIASTSSVTGLIGGGFVGQGDMRTRVIGAIGGGVLALIAYAILRAFIIVPGGGG